MIESHGKKEWRANWAVVVAAMTGLAASHVHLYSMGVMIAPLEKEFGWSRTQISFGFLIISMIVFPLSPFMGMAVDRFGPRRIALCGLTIYCLSVALLSLAQQALWTWWLLWLLIAFGCLFVTPTVWVAAIKSLFFASRGLALAVALSAVGVISFAGPLLTYFLVEHFGWRMTYVLWGGTAAAIALPMIYFYLPDAKVKARTELTTRTFQKGNVGSSFSFREGIKSAAFLKLAVAGPIMSVLFTALVVNLVPMLTFSGIHTATAAAISGIVGISQLVGRLSGGALLDRYNARRVGAAIVTFPIIACLMLIAFAGSVPVSGIAVLVFGLAAGAELDVLAYLASRFFGIRNFGVLFGSIIGLASLGSGLGPVLASSVYDRTGSYVPVLWAIIPLCMLSSYSFLSLGPYPKFDDEEAQKKEGHSVPAA